MNILIEKDNDQVFFIIIISADCLLVRINIRSAMIVVSYSWGLGDAYCFG